MRNTEYRTVRSGSRVSRENGTRPSPKPQEIEQQSGSGEGRGRSPKSRLKTRAAPLSFVFPFRLCPSSKATGGKDAAWPPPSPPRRGQTGRINDGISYGAQSRGRPAAGVDHHARSPKP